ncbi:hypothetical protein HYFRA_00009637 [Hymenoscyphus fraxineus]|uniref:Uncharacterized protein n=1 Tax=Hymenoscyphus fraxineus TaxID=746836 RepID=A0A9N9KT83_9HELO|nr:hypothetical protein HYFRA_00009637 [Hymenoscyphus fraxineus]
MPKSTSIVHFLKAAIEVIPHITLLTIILSWFTIIPTPTENSQAIIWLLPVVIATVSNIIVLIYYGANPASDTFTSFSHTTLTHRKIAFARVALCGAATVFETVYILVLSFYQLVTNPRLAIVSEDGTLNGDVIFLDVFCGLWFGLLLCGGVALLWVIVECVWMELKKEAVKDDNETISTTESEEEGKRSFEA